MPSKEIHDLLGVVTLGQQNTTDAAQLTVAELMIALAASTVFLDSQTAKLRALQDKQTTTTEAFAALLRFAMDSSKTIHQLNKDLEHATMAVHENQHKLADSSSKIKQLTTELTNALTFGRHDRNRLCKISQENRLLQKLHSISTHTCAKLRRQKNGTELQLHVLQALLARRNSNDDTLIQQPLESIPVQTPTKSQVS